MSDPTASDPVTGSAGDDPGPPSDYPDDAGAEADDAADEDAGGEYIEGTFGGESVTLAAATNGIDPNDGYIDLTATPTGASYPRINVTFAPSLGTTTCAAGLQPQVDFVASNTEEYVSAGEIPGSTCSITVTQIGPRGGAIRGTFAATMKQYLDGGGVTLEAHGSFNVVRRE